jgi:hypothetical protein
VGAGGRGGQYIGRSDEGLLQLEEGQAFFDLLAPAGLALEVVNRKQQLFWAKGNNPSVPELRLLEMGENELAKLHVSVAHVNYGGWTYTTGWEQVLGKYTEIMQADTELREKAALMKRVAALEMFPRLRTQDEGA